MSASGITCKAHGRLLENGCRDCLGPDDWAIGGTARLTYCESCSRQVSSAECQPGWAHFHICPECYASSAVAYKAGIADGRADTYDSRPFPRYEEFTAYGHGRAVGLRG